jgi:hypothetical protein
MAKGFRALSYPNAVAVLGTGVHVTRSLTTSPCVSVVVAWLDQAAPRRCIASSGRSLMPSPAGGARVFRRS